MRKQIWWIASQSLPHLAHVPRKCFCFFSFLFPLSLPASTEENVHISPCKSTKNLSFILTYAESQSVRHMHETIIFYYVCWEQVLPAAKKKNDSLSMIQKALEMLRKMIKMSMSPHAIVSIVCRLYKWHFSHIHVLFSPPPPRNSTF